MRLWIGNIVVLVMMALVMEYGVAEVTVPSTQGEHVAGDFFERTMLRFANQRKLFLDGFDNATALLQKKYDDIEERGSAGEARGKKKKLKHMNRVLMAIVMAYTLKFMFLIPTFVGTLILFKFTAGLAGFFYALFAAVLGLDNHSHRDH